ncbi:replication initiation factor domain-containing protein [Streptococcus ruminantium]|uniref:Replication initiation factor domain-containing protein n=1 Tax=Streptococcus ruminantium TaxID=1917441 RepID=A0ABU1B2N0_9STRE|nr:replication initiation factor domain-containing protein [Streptococcus ruminantium]MDQ8759087.1 replication initiation factor domain-containing protein [Streptococcus ruminantium]MDQ8769643.1 replication initiation factor domain-containing protein [Streptococcus ruminantium]MDQ8775535.1 replication initiation factor domain-containing protein [Streptococcus ruminantium]MDQ8794448.1 replication initiation factor domain-containing protein [Streptococcus ruminantium]MDQ8796683.1 replication ini
MTKERIVNGRYLKKFRKDKIKLSQKDFALSVGFSLDAIKSYESNRRLLTVDKFLEMKERLGYSNHESDRLEVLIDYMRITFKDVRDLDFFTTRYLHCPLSDFESEETKLMMYTHLWKRGDIWIFDYADKSQTDNYQITIQLSGRGCRQFELIMERDNVSWVEVLQKMYFERNDMQVRRLDIAMDELYRGYEHEDEHIKLSDLIVKLYSGELFYEKMKTWNSVDGGRLDGSANQGLSIYFGSRQSNMYFNFYEKRYEIARRENMTVFESLGVFGIWNRYEIRLAREKAQSVVEEFCGGVDLAEIARGLINSRLDVFDGTNAYGGYVADEKWQRLFGGVEPLKLSTRPEPYDIESTVKWLIYQVSNSLTLVHEADKILNTQYINMILEAGEITDKTRQILESLKVGAKDYEEIYGS